MQTFDRAIGLDPQDVNGQLGKGMALYKQGKYDEALNCFDKALEPEPQAPLNWYRKSIILNALGRTSEANKAYAKAKELDPSEHVFSFKPF